MEFLIVPIEDLKTIDPNWEDRRKSNDGTKAIIHKEIFDELVPQVMTLNLVEGEDPLPRTYPYDIKTGDEINAMEEFTNKEPMNEELVK